MWARKVTWKMGASVGPGIDACAWLVDLRLLVNSAITCLLFWLLQVSPFRQPGWIHNSVFFVIVFLYQMCLWSVLMFKLYFIFLEAICFLSQMRLESLRREQLFLFCFHRIPIWSTGFDVERIRKNSNLKQSISEALIISWILMRSNIVSHY